jgi:enoyl-CoA hydratase/carnithine racemase
MADGSGAGTEHRVSVQITDGVADVRLDRAAKRNALDRRCSRRW